MTKPFKLEELLARVRVQLRDERGGGADGARGRRDHARRPHPQGDGRRRRGRPDRARVHDARDVHAATPARCSRREQLLAHVWGYDYDPGSNVVEVYVRYLRRKLGEDAIETVRGMGYRLR